MLLVALFVLGYVAVVFERPLNLNKAASALLTGVLCWAVHARRDGPAAVERLPRHLAEIAGVLFFLLGAMAVVELVDAHGGFELLTERITARGRRRLLGVVAAATFGLSAVLDNLTTAIVMASLLRRLVPDADDRRLYAGVVVIAANAGGVWSPIGDVTTTMLWAGGQVSAGAVVGRLFAPAVVSVAVPLAWVARGLKGDLLAADDGAARPARDDTTTARERAAVLVVGMGGLLFVPAFKALTHLPPVMGVLLALGALWAFTDAIHRRKDESLRGPLSAAGALQRVDSPSVLFFLGVLLAVGALESAGVLRALARALGAAVGRVEFVTLAIGLASAVIDNVPLVAAAQGMYAPGEFPLDHRLWVFLAYCAGTGGSILVVGSAAGVAVMGLERLTFGWYLRRLSLPALVGYAAGAAVYLAGEWLRALR